MKLTGENRRTRGKTCPSATLSTTNLTWTDPGSNPGLRGGRPAANRLSHGMARLILTRLKQIPAFYGIFRLFTALKGDERRRSWLRHCATRREFPTAVPSKAVVNFKVTCSFCLHSVVPGSTQPLTEMNTKEFPLE
jgi:hypothetical protein